jgi:hypothetical protein
VKLTSTHLLTRDGTDILVILVTAEEAAKLRDCEHVLNQLPFPIVVAAPSVDLQSDSQFEFFGPLSLTAFARHNIDSRTQWQELDLPLPHLPWHS